MTARPATTPGPAGPNPAQHRQTTARTEPSHEKRSQLQEHQQWLIEDDFQNSKELTALDEHQVRTWTSWHRWTLLAMLAHAFLAVTTARAHDTTPADELIPLTVNEVRHLLVRLAFPRPQPATSFILAWSWWRRRHQARAQASHYQRQATALQLN